MNNDIQSQMPVVQYVLSAEDLRGVFRDVMEEVVNDRETVKVGKQPDEMLTASEVATRLKVSKTTLWRWSRENYLKPLKIGSRSLYRESDVRKIMEG